MQITEHNGRTLKYLAIEPDGYERETPYPMVILLHGFGASMSDLASLSSVIDSQNYVYICPNAPMPVQLGLGMTGYAWTPPGEKATLQDVQNADAQLSTLFEEVLDQYQVEPGQAILGGFSQGGMMTYRCGLQRPDLFRGLLVLSARVQNNNDLKSLLPSERNQHIFIAHGNSDHLIPIQDARQSLEFLEAEGYTPKYREYPMGHEISQAVLNDIVPWVQRVMMPIRFDIGGK